MLTDSLTAPMILVVEDDNNHALLIQRSLEETSEEYRLVRVDTIAAAMAATEKHSPSLILTDYRLPDGEGIEFISLANGACPVVIMTSYGNEQVAVEAMKIGVQDYIVKSPEAFEALPHTVALALKTWSLILARRLADKAVIRAKRDWERTFDAVPDLISIIDINHTITRVNRAMADRCGLTADEVVGRKCYEVVHGLSDSPCFCPSIAMIQDGRVHNAEIAEKVLNGFYDVTVSPLFDEQGRVTAFVHVMRDTAEHRKTEELVHQRLKLRDLAPTSSIAELMQATLDTCERLTESSIGFFHIVDEDQLNLTLQVWSSNTLATMCTSQEHVSHYPISQAGVWAECFHTRKPVIHNDYAKLPNRKELPVGHAPLIRELTVPVVINGKVVSIIGVGNKASPYTQHDIYIVKQFVTFATEVLGRKRATIDLKESEENYRKLANMQQAILNNSTVGIIFVKNRKVLWANPAHCTMFGYEAGEIENMDTAEFYADKESYVCVGEKGYPIIASGGIFSEDLMMKKKDGALIWCNLVGQAINPENMEEGSIWSMMDITARKRAEEERQQLEHQFHQAQKLESLGLLAGGIAHDFNNILTVILGHCYMAREDYIPEKDFKATFKQIEAAGNRAADLCRQMLTYAGKSPLVQTRVNLWMLVDEVVKMLQAAIKKNVTIELDLKRVVPEITGDAGQIQQIIMNLIINAAEAIGEANGTIRVALTRVQVKDDQIETDTFGTVVQAGGYICLEVTDSGSGMDEDTQKRIFEPFFTTKFTGRGLGMSAIHGIITSHDAILQMTSRPGVGTTFKVLFPLPESPDYTETISTAAASPGKPGATILLVEDEQVLRDMGTELLEAMGFTTLTSQNGKEALELYRAHSGEINVILLDLTMPEMGGIEAYHELRKISPTLPIIICSGYSVESVQDVITNDPHAGFVQKPYKPIELRDALMAKVGEIGP